LWVRIAGISRRKGNSGFPPFSKALAAVRNKIAI
jgi:hypothetical protein